MAIEDIHILIFQQLLVFQLKLKFFGYPYSMKKEKKNRKTMALEIG